MYNNPIRDLAVWIRMAKLGDYRVLIWKVEQSRVKFDVQSPEFVLSLFNLSRRIYVQRSCKESSNPAQDLKKFAVIRKATQVFRPVDRSHRCLSREERSSLHWLVS